MIIGVISDTHGDKYSIYNAIKELIDVDLIIHLGDNVKDVKEINKYYKNKIISVKGNCDFCNISSSEKIKMIDGKRFFITHGHKYNVKYNLLNLKYKAIEMKADVVLFGHTHIPYITYEENIWFVNPGSASLPRMKEPSIAIIKIKNGDICPYIKKIKKKGIYY